MPVESRGWTNTRDAARWPYSVSCSQIGCNFAVCCATPGEGEEILMKHEAEGPCPYGREGARKGMPVGKSLREMQWEQLDAAVDRAVDPETSPNHKEQAKGEILGIAKCIFLMDQPFWASPEAVMKEGAERLKMRKGEIPHRETPGCQVPHSVQELHEKNRATVQKVPATRHPLDSQIEKLSDATVRRILKGIGVGMDAEVLSELYRVELAVVRRMAAQPDRFARSGG